MQVRVENLYYLLCYAWNELDARSLVSVDDVDGRSPERLFARVFITLADRLLQQRLDKGYLGHQEDVRRPRGKLDAAATIGRGLLLRGQVHCIHDDLTEDVLHNRIVKAAAYRLAQLEGLTVPQRARLSGIQREMRGVGVHAVASSDFRRVQLHSNLRRYRLLLHVCELVHRCTLFNERSGRLEFHSFTGNEREMGALFEAFLRSFLQAEQRTFPRVEARQVEWAVQGDDAGLLPVMKTDVLLRRPGARVVLEAKCYREPTVASFGGREHLRSKDVYQLMSYVLNASAKFPEEAVSGALVYAVDEDKVPRASFSILGKTLHVFPVNLDRPWPQIHASLLELVSLLCGLG